MHTCLNRFKTKLELCNETNKFKNLVVFTKCITQLEMCDFLIMYILELLLTEDLLGLTIAREF